MKEKQVKKLEIKRHSMAHILATAMLEMFPEAKFGIGPAVENGFYYDFDLPRTLIPEDLEILEEKMKAIIKENYEFKMKEMAIDDAIKHFEKAGQPLKIELLENLKKAKTKMVSVYKSGPLVDLCKGPHLNSTGEIDSSAFKLTRISGAYWLGDEKKQQLQRVYGVAFNNKKELKQYLFQQEEAKKRDHRVIGKELDLFSFHNEGHGFAFWHPRGMDLRTALMEPYNKLHKEHGYKEISTPIMLSEELWHKSGHWDNYKDNMYFTKIDDKPYAIKPMNCPGAIIIYNTKPRSYRDFPIILGEKGEVHRHEPSGTLHGLFRVRAFRQDDSHIFCRKDQVKDEIKKVVNMTLDFYKIFDFSDVFIEVSTRPEKSIGSLKMWDESENIMKSLLDDLNIDYTINEGDGAFYGPKIDFHIKDAIGRSWQCGTVQLDFSMPEKFDLTYTNDKGESPRPVMIHRTIFGSIQRFVGILIEHYAGAFPTWLAPVQVGILPVSEKFSDYADKVNSVLRESGIRVEMYNQDEGL
jgi:threonyl-tRNA synthetase